MNTYTRPMLNGTHITLVMGNLCFDMYTFSRDFGKSRPFCIVRDSFSEWLNDTTRSEYYTQHIDSPMRASKVRDMVRFEIKWLREVRRNRYEGFAEAFCLPIGFMREFLDTSEDEITHYLHVNRAKTMRVVSENACQTIRAIRKNPRAMRAFVKYMRSWHWDGDTIILYNDFVKLSFYFEAIGASKICGGLILHEGKPDNKHHQLYYGIHT